MTLRIFDIECNGLKPDKIWCVGACSGAHKDVKRTTSYKRMQKLFETTDVLVGHNIISFDIPVVEKILGVKVKAKLVDTLYLSWYLDPHRPLHGLDSYGAEFGIPKPKVDDWDDLPIEVYLHRVEEDVRINTLLWERQFAELLEIYGTEEKVWKFIDYLSFKGSCIREQERLRWRLDVQKATRHLEDLQGARERKTDELGEAMPAVPITKKKKRPKQPYKKSGDLSAIGQKWHDLTVEHGKHFDFLGEIEVVDGHKPPNPGSVPQLKKWLSSLGWEPDTFKYVRDKETGDVRKIPQINLPDGKGICPSIKRLYAKEPALELLDGLSIIVHRISVFNGFLNNVDEDGYVQATIQGLTNTLRFKHKVVVNLPGIDKPWGKEIRGCLMAPEGYELVGSDMSSLEDRTKQHYMWDYDPAYVKEMMTDDFDPHLDLCVIGGLLSDLEAKQHKLGLAMFPRQRAKGKAANYSCVYGAGGATVARAAGIPVKEGEQLVETYWKRNWSVKAIAEDCVTKRVKGKLWLYNPVSGFWYSLRYEKDRFSTLNQGTGVFVFDTWVKHVKKRKLPIIGQMHDEVIGLIRKGKRDKATKALKDAVADVNKELNLNRDMDVDVQFGNNYSEIH